MTLSCSSSTSLHTFFFPVTQRRGRRHERRAGNLDGTGAAAASRSKQFNVPSVSPNTGPVFPGFAGQNASVSTSDGEQSRVEPRGVTPGSACRSCGLLAASWGPANARRVPCKLNASGLRIASHAWSSNRVMLAVAVLH
jgi:hypothetical protein